MLNHQRVIKVLKLEFTSQHFATTMNRLIVLLFGLVLMVVIASVSAWGWGGYRRFGWGGGYGYGWRRPYYGGFYGRRWGWGYGGGYWG